MKKIDSYYFGIGMNDYEVKVITNDNLDIRRGEIDEAHGGKI